MIELTQTFAEFEPPIAMSPLGESAILVEFGKGIHPEIHRRVKAFTNLLDHCPFAGMIEYVAAFASITVFYDPVIVKGWQTDAIELKDRPAYEIVISILQALAEKLTIQLKPVHGLLKFLSVTAESSDLI